MFCECSWTVSSFFFLTLRTQVVDVACGNPRQPLLPLVPFWDAMNDKGALALFSIFQPGRYQSSRGREKLVQMIGGGYSEGSQHNYENGQCKLLANNLAHLSLKGVWNSFVFLNEIQMCFWPHPPWVSLLSQDPEKQAVCLAHSLPFLFIMWASKQDIWLPCLKTCSRKISLSPLADLSVGLKPESTGWAWNSHLKSVTRLPSVPCFALTHSGMHTPLCSKSQQKPGISISETIVKWYWMSNVIEIYK